MASLRPLRGLRDSRTRSPLPSLERLGLDISALPGLVIGGCGLIFSGLFVAECRDWCVSGEVTRDISLGSRNRGEAVCAESGGGGGGEKHRLVAGQLSDIWRPFARCAASGTRELGHRFPALKGWA